MFRTYQRNEKESSKLNRQSGDGEEENDKDKCIMEDGCDPSKSTGTSRVEDKEPYNKFNLEYFEAKKQNDPWFMDFVGRLEDKHYSNSDVTRLVKQAKTISGQDAIENNFFIKMGYYSNALNNTKKSQGGSSGKQDATFSLDELKLDEYYVSTITPIKTGVSDLSWKGLFTIDHLTNMEGGNIVREQNKELMDNIYIHEQPDNLCVTYGNEETYYNVKGLIYKNENFNIDRSEIPVRDIFIRFDKKGFVEPRDLQRI